MLNGMLAQDKQWRGFLVLKKTPLNGQTRSFSY